MLEIYSRFIEDHGKSYCLQFWGLELARNLIKDQGLVLKSCYLNIKLLSGLVLEID